MSQEKQDEIIDTSSQQGTVTTMLIVCGAAGFVFSIIYCVCFLRGKKSDNNNNNNQTQEHSNLTSSAPVLRTKFTHARENKERQPGDPIFDKITIAGVASLGILLWIGSTIVLFVVLAEQSKFVNASKNDFESLGRCLVESSVNYTFFDVQVNSLNSLCMEQWEYNVSTTKNKETLYFVSAPMLSKSCQNSCQVCQSQARLFGPDYYVGLDPKRRGTYIVPNQTLVECFAPTIPVSQLSDYYSCGRQRDSQNTCFLLEDTAEALKKEQESVMIGLIAVYCGYSFGTLLLFVAALFVYKNKLVRDEELMAQANTNAEVVRADNDEKQEEGSNVDDCEGIVKISKYDTAIS